MAVRRLHTEQPASFEFDAANLEWASQQMAQPRDHGHAPELGRLRELHKLWQVRPGLPDGGSVQEGRDGRGDGEAHGLSVVDHRKTAAERWGVMAWQR